MISKRLKVYLKRINKSNAQDVIVQISPKMEKTKMERKDLYVRIAEKF